MISTKLILIVLVTSAIPVFSQFDRPPNRAGDEDTIMRSIAQTSAAYVARDPAPFELLYRDDYISIHEKPVFNARKRLIAMMRADEGPLRAGKKLDFETLSYENEVPMIHFYGQAAIVNVAKKNLWQYRGNKCLTRTQGTDLWLKRDGVWQIALNQATTFQCEPKPFYPMHPAVAAIPALTKAPANADLEAENQVRSVVYEIFNISSPSDASAAPIIERLSAKDFVATDSSGLIVSDRSILASMPRPVASRIPGLRNRDDAVIVFGDAAIFTYRSKTTGAGGSQRLEQCTLILVRQKEKWLIVAAHFTRIGAE